MHMPGLEDDTQPECMRFAETLPAWAVWIAQDADGTWWAYEAEPNQQHNGWYENEVGRILRLGRTAPPADWQATLTRTRLADPP